MSRVLELFVHPLKGARPVRVSRLRLDALGAVGDRRWVLATPDGVQVTPRTVPALAQLHATLPMHEGAVLADSPLTLSTHGRDPLVVPATAAHAPRVPIQLWDDRVPLADAGDAAAEWCSDAIGVTCRLLQVTADTQRPLAPRYAGPLLASARHVAATDGAPLLLLGTASLDALNARLAADGHAPLPMARFRPNLVLATTVPHEEDRWSHVRVGDVALGVGTSCARCAVTTLDPETLQQGVEPLRTLARYRRLRDGGVGFGMNATHATEGEIARGDAVTLLALRDDTTAT